LLNGGMPVTPSRSLTIKLDGQTHAVSWREADDGTRLFAVDGVETSWEAERMSPGRWLLRRGTRQVTVDVDGTFPKTTATVSAADGEMRAVALELALPAAPASAAMRATTSAGEPTTVRAMMPGRVVKVLVQVGQAVRTGEPLLVVEAMKMQNDIVAPRDAKVLALHCAEGVAVEAHQDLVSLG
jgi:biotin carboxyl carrier protein